jgi:hypothetical protein
MLPKLDELPFVHLDSHNLHITLNVVHKTMGVGLYLVTLPSHIAHALQPLDVSCFKPSKLFKKHIKMFGHWLMKGGVIIKRIWHNGCF